MRNLAPRLDARLYAVQILSDAERQNRRLSDVINDHLGSKNLPLEIRPTVTHLVQEITRWRGYLDYLLSRYYKGRFHKIEYLLRNILRLGAYERVFRTHIPEYAVVNEAVKLTRTLVNEDAVGITNAILRKIHSTDRPNLEELRPGDSPERISAITSHPRWMIDRWLRQFGFDRTLDLCVWNNQPPTFTVRRNRIRVNRKDFELFLDRANVSWKRKKSLPDFYDVDHISRLMETDQFRMGHYSVQDLSAGLVVQLLDADASSTILDVCAAPGGKSSYLAERLRNKGRIHAYDVEEARLTRLRATVKRLGLDSIQISKRDTTSDEFPVADSILLDGPCTGTGVMAKRADLRWRRNEKDIKEMSMLQLKMLFHMWTFVRKRGALVYATCSLEDEENWGVVDRFLSGHKGVRIRRANGRVPNKYVDERGALHTFPPAHGLDGVFAVILQRTV